VFAQSAATTLAGEGGGASAAAGDQQIASAALARAWDATIHDAAAARLAGLPTMHPLFAPPPQATSTPAPPRPASQVMSKFPMFFEWGRLPWRPPQETRATPRQGDATGDQDALQAYFEALGATRPPEQGKP